MGILRNLLRAILPPPPNGKAVAVPTDIMRPDQVPSEEPQRNALRQQIAATCMATNQVNDHIQRIQKNADRFGTLIQNMRHT